MNMSPNWLQNTVVLVLTLSAVTNGLPTTLLNFSPTSPTSSTYLTSPTTRTSTEESTTTESSPTFGLTVNIPRIPARPVRVATTTTTESPIESSNNRRTRFKPNKSTIGVAMGGGGFLVVAASFIAPTLRDDEKDDIDEEMLVPVKKKRRRRRKKKKKRKSLHRIVERVSKCDISTQTDHYIEQDESTRPDTKSLELILNTNKSDNNPTGHSPQMSGSKLSDSQSLPPSPTPQPSVPSINTSCTPSQTSLTSSDDSPRLPPSPAPIASYSINEVPVAPKRQPSSRQRSTIPTPELSPRRPLSAWGPPEPRECWQGPSGSYTTDNRQTKDYYYPVKNPWEWNRTP